MSLAGVSILSIALLASACAKSTTPASNKSAASSNSSTIAAAAWAYADCSALATFENATNAEDASFKADNPPDAPGLKSLEVSYVEKYISITQAVVDQLKSGGTPDIPDGSGYVSGYLKAFSTFASSLQSDLSQANALDTTKDPDTFTSDDNDITSSMGDAWSTFVDDWNGVDPQFTNPGDNPLVDAMNNDANCKTFRSSSSSSSSSTASSS